MVEIKIHPILEDNMEVFDGGGIKITEEEPGMLQKKKYALKLVTTVPVIKEIIKRRRDGEDRKEIMTYENFLLKISKAYLENGEVILNHELKPFDGASAKYPGLNVPKSLLKLFHEKGYIENWQELSVSPAEVYKKLWKIYDYYLDIEPEVISLFSVYTIASYFYVLFPSFPYIYLWGARQSGKTKTLGLFQRLCFNAIATMNLSASSLFRLVETFGSTLCIDESEYLKDVERKSEMQTLLFAGYKKDTANVLRVEGEKRKEVKIYRVFSPKIMASINYPNDVLMDRCIMVNMKRGHNREKLNREPSGDFSEIREDLYKLLLTRFDEVYEIKDMDFEHEHLIARERELWRPLLVIAYWIKAYLPEEEGAELWNHMLVMLERNLEIKEGLRVDTELNTLLYALLSLVKEDGYISNEAIIEKILEPYVADDVNYKAMKKIYTPQKIGRMMSSLGFPRKRRDGSGKTYYYVSVEKVKSLAEAYGISTEDSEVSEDTSERRQLALNE